MLLTINPLSQRDSRWASQRLGTVNGSTIGSEGCVVTSMSMLATYYGHSVLPNELDDLLTDQNLYTSGNLFVNSSITQLYPDIKFDKAIFCESTPAPITEIKSYLDQKKPVVVALMNHGVRHYVLVVGYDDNQMYANDPWEGDQVAINSRWGDPATVILQCNFFSGNIVNHAEITQQITQLSEISGQLADENNALNFIKQNLNPDSNMEGTVRSWKGNSDDLAKLKPQLADAQSKINELNTKLFNMSTQQSNYTNTSLPIDLPVSPVGGKIRSSLLTSLINFIKKNLGSAN